MMTGHSRLLLLLGFRILQTAGYGFKYPRGSDQLHPGQLINITWSTADDYVDLFLSGGYFIGQPPPDSDFRIVGNLSNIGWFQWQIPSNLSSDQSSICSIRLMNSITEMYIISTEYLSLQPASTSVASPTGTWASFTGPTGAPEASLRDETTVNITWQTQAQFINLSFSSEVHAPVPIFEMQKNPGYYLWTADDLTSHFLPMYFSLQSNESKYADAEVLSGGFYVEPNDYPSTKTKSSVGLNGGFLYPTTKDTTTLRFNDTMTFLWDPPVPESWDLVMVLVSETSSLRTDTLEYDSAYRPVSYNTTSMTWRMEFIDTLPVDAPYHFNLLVNATRFDFASSRFIYRSETFTMKQPTGSETTWTPPVDQIPLVTSTPAATSSGRTNPTGEVAPGNGNKGLTPQIKLGIGLGVPFGIVLIMLAILIWLFRKRQAEGGKMPRLSSQTIRKGELDATAAKSARRQELEVAESFPAQVFSVMGSPVPTHSSRRYEMPGNDGATELL